MMKNAAFFLYFIVTGFAISAPFSSYAVESKTQKPTTYTQYRLIKQEFINNQTVCTYENVRGDILTRTHKYKTSCIHYINTDRN